MEQKSAESSENELPIQKDRLDIQQFAMPYKELADFSNQKLYV